jgi:hypothetical protein
MPPSWRQQFEYIFFDIENNPPSLPPSLSLLLLLLQAPYQLLTPA